MDFNALQQVRQQQPLIHCIANVVSAPLSANGLIACGGRPIMAEDLEEVAEITSFCQGLSLNLGTPNPRKISAMLLAGQTANQKNIPIVFDPVGVGASNLRKAAAKELLEKVQFSIIRGNLSEMKLLADGTGHCMGVDAGDSITENNLPQVIDFAKEFAKEVKAIIAISSVIDIVTDGETTYIIRNGDAMLSKVSGTGCLLSVLLIAFFAVNKAQPLEACATALCTMGICGERSAKEAKGNGDFSIRLLDELSNIAPEQLKEEANYEQR